MVRIVLVLSLAVLAACGSRSEGLRDLRSSTAGPDDFSTVPAAPLQTPPSFAELPTPTPGGSNRADVDPIAEAVAALGGSGRAASGDGALIAHAARFGSDPSIRSELFAADETFRKRRAGLRLPVLGRSNRYYSAYAGQALDAQAETQRFRALGVDVPAAPPSR